MSRKRRIQRLFILACQSRLENPSHTVHSSFRRPRDATNVVSYERNLNGRAMQTNRVIDEGSHWVYLCRCWHSGLFESGTMPRLNTDCDRSVKRLPMSWSALDWIERSRTSETVSCLTKHHLMLHEPSSRLAERWCELPVTLTDVPLRLSGQCQVVGLNLLACIAQIPTCQVSHAEYILCVLKFGTNNARDGFQMN